MSLINKAALATTQECLLSTCRYKQEYKLSQIQLKSETNGLLSFTESSPNLEYFWCCWRAAGCNSIGPFPDQRNPPRVMRQVPLNYENSLYFSLPARPTVWRFAKHFPCRSSNNAFLSHRN